MEVFFHQTSLLRVLSRRIFADLLGQAVAIFNVQGQNADNNDVQNLLAELRRARPSSFFLDGLTSALLFRVHHDDAYNNHVVAVDYLDQSVHLRPKFDISTGEPSWFNAAAET